MATCKNGFGRMASSIIGPEVATSFEGMQRFTLLMIQLILVMVPLVLLINGLTKHNWAETFFFSIAVAVGLTPKMLPMIVSVCLSNGALGMSKKKVIVKRLNSVQNLGAMDVLCTGTLTLDRVIPRAFLRREAERECRRTARCLSDRSFSDGSQKCARPRGTEISRKP
jgi:P-type Mg2+ transporter